MRKFVILNLMSIYERMTLCVMIYEVIYMRLCKALRFVVFDIDCNINL